MKHLTPFIFGLGKDLGERGVGEAADSHKAIKRDARFVEHSFDGGEGEVERVRDGLIAETTFFENSFEGFEEMSGVLVVGLEAHSRMGLVSDYDAIVNMGSISC